MLLGSVFFPKCHFKDECSSYGVAHPSTFCSRGGAIWKGGGQLRKPGGLGGGQQRGGGKASPRMCPELTVGRLGINANLPWTLVQPMKDWSRLFGTWLWREFLHALCGCSGPLHVPKLKIHDRNEGGSGEGERFKRRLKVAYPCSPQIIFFASFSPWCCSHENFWWV